MFKAFKKCTDAVTKMSNALNNMETILKKDNKVKDNNWIDLDVSNIPNDFFVNEGYEVSTYYGGQWVVVYSYNLPGMRTEVIDQMINNGIKYRYRLKPLEPIRVTKGFVDDINECGRDFSSFIKDMEECYGRPVEIID